MPIYTVVGIYEDNNQRWAESFNADSPEDAEKQVNNAEPSIIVAAVIEGEVNVVA